MLLYLGGDCDVVVETPIPVAFIKRPIDALDSYIAICRKPAEYRSIISAFHGAPWIVIADCILADVIDSSHSSFSSLSVSDSAAASSVFLFVVQP